jgi:hypothetical protein
MGDTKSLLKIGFVGFPRMRVLTTSSFSFKPEFWSTNFAVYSDGILKFENVARCRTGFVVIVLGTEKSPKF